MNPSETAALLKLSRDEHIGVRPTDARTLETENKAVAGTRPAARAHNLKRWLLGLLSG